MIVFFYNWSDLAAAAAAALANDEQIFHLANDEQIHHQMVESTASLPFFFKQKKCQNIFSLHPKPFAEVIILLSYDI